MRACLLWTGLSACLLMIAAVPRAGAQFCDNGLVTKGSTQAEVRKACGEPACIRRPQEIFVDKAGVYVPLAMDQEWIYNPGPYRFLFYIRFYQGKVVDQRVGDFGWEGKTDCRDLPPPR